MELLIAGEAEELATHEAVIEQGLTRFIQVGSALLAIKEANLYRASHGTFEEYCRDRWGLSRFYAHRLIEAATTVENLLPIGNVDSTPLPMPSTESQVRPLTRLEPLQQREAWTQAVAVAPNGKPTAKVVAEAAEKVAPRERASDRRETRPEPRSEAPLPDLPLPGQTSFLPPDEPGADPDREKIDPLTLVDFRKLFNRHLGICNYIKRRGGVPVLSETLSDVELRRLAKLCTLAINHFATIKTQIREARSCRARV